MKQTNAERQKRYRDQCRKRGKKAPSGSRSKNRGSSGKSKWDAAEFIALDGEGESNGEIQAFTVKATKKKYFAKNHDYTLLAASTGESLYNGGKRLESMACVNWLCDLADNHKKAIFVIFAGSYDINHMFMYGFERADIKTIASGATLRFQAENIEYEVEYRARKSLTIRRGLSFVAKEVTNKTTGKKEKKFFPKWASKITVWDVFGFFQENFVGVMGKWLGTDHRHYELIKRMKSMRGDFAAVDQKEINAYNAAELESLVELMQKVHSAVDGLELKCTRWDGAGAIAAALMRKHEIKEFKAITPDYLIEAVATAYAGGRIEVCKIGCHNDKVWDYDVNSAYPFVMESVPCLAHGIWEEGGGDQEPPEGFTLVHCEFKFQEGLPFYPLFYRTEAMQISFSSRGEGIYWYPEYKAALLCPGIVTVKKWWHFKPGCNHKPFHWIGEYYKTRQKWVKNPAEEWQTGGEKIIKLGLNSLYGKSAQQVGGRAGAPPAYHQLEWAGYITSSTRARLFTAAMENPEAVIGFATDGIFTTAPLPFQHSADKSMGEWDVKVFDGLTIAMAGVYWWHTAAPCGDSKKVNYKHFSRGFDKEAMQSPQLVIDAWKAGKTGLDIKMHRLIGMGSAAVSDTFWEMRGRFVDSDRTLDLTGGSYKRRPIDIKKQKPWKNLVATKVSMNIRYENNLQGCSFPYPLEWQQNEDYKTELEQEAENGDTENI